MVANALGWRPAVIYTTLVSATDIPFSRWLRDLGGASSRTTRSRPSTSRIPPTRSGTTSGGEAYNQVMAKYYPAGNPQGRPELLRRRGGACLRAADVQAREESDWASLMKAYRTWNESLPFLLPGNTKGCGTNSADQRPIDCLRLQRFNNGVFNQVSQLTCKRSRRKTESGLSRYFEGGKTPPRRPHASQDEVLLGDLLHRRLPCASSTSRTGCGLRRRGRSTPTLRHRHPGR